MSFGSASSYTTPVLSDEQKARIKSETDFFTGTIVPAYTGAVQGATDVYNRNIGGVTNAAQYQAGTARQAGQTLGETGESALRSGITGLQSLFAPEYEQNQIAAAMGPAQAQYQQNLQNQMAQFGGSGNLGSARQALADRQLAGQAQSQQAATAAQIQRDIAQQRASAASSLAGLGQGGLGQAMGAAGQVVSASQVPQDLFNKYASVLFGAPAASYTGSAPFGSAKTGTDYGIKI